MKRRSCHELEGRGQAVGRNSLILKTCSQMGEEAITSKDDVPITTVGGRAEEKGNKVKTLRSRKRIMVHFVHSYTVLLFLTYINKILVWSF